MKCLRCGKDLKYGDVVRTMLWADLWCKHCKTGHRMACGILKAIATPHSKRWQKIPNKCLAVLKSRSEA